MGAELMLLARSGLEISDLLAGQLCPCGAHFRCTSFLMLVRICVIDFLDWMSSVKAAG